MHSIPAPLPITSMRHGLVRVPLRCFQALAVLGVAVGCGSVDPEKKQVQPGTGGSAGAQGVGGDGNVSGNVNGGAGPSPVSGPLLPWQVGNSWTYDVTLGGVVTQKTTTVGDLGEVGGTGPNAALMAYYVLTAKGTDLADRTESWQAPDPAAPDRIVRYRERGYAAQSDVLKIEEHWEPSKLHVDGSPERTVAGSSWLEIYSETKLAVGLAPTTNEARDRWTVLADDETVTVPAGTFEPAIHLQKAGGSGTAKEYWYVRGVGKVKETGTQTEELTDYTLVEAP